MKKVFGLVLVLALMFPSIALAQDVINQSVEPSRVYVVVSDKMLETYNYSFIFQLTKDVAGYVVFPDSMEKNDRVNEFIDLAHKNGYTVMTVFFKHETVETPIYEKSDYILVGSNDVRVIEDMIKELDEKGFNGKIILQYLQKPVRGQNATNVTYEENVPLSFILEKAKNSKVSGVIVNVPKENVQDVVAKMKSAGLETYTVVAQSLSFFGLNPEQTVRNIAEAQMYYDYVIFFSFEELTPRIIKELTVSEPLDTTPSNQMGINGMSIVYALIVVIIIALIVLGKRKTKNKGDEEKKKENSNKS